MCIISDMKPITTYNHKQHVRKLVAPSPWLERKYSYLSECIGYILYTVVTKYPGYPALAFL